MPENPPASPSKPVAPWYLAYLILGLINSGLLPFILPLDVASRFHDLGDVALVIGAYNAGMLPAPVLGVLMGFGVGAAATVAPLFVIDFAPRAEWEPRIGWLQSFNGAGQLAGLLLAGVVAAGSLAVGFWLAAGFAALALVLGRIGLPREAQRPPMRLPRLAWADLMRIFPGPGLLSGPWALSCSRRCCLRGRWRRLSGLFSAGGWSRNSATNRCW